MGIDMASVYAERYRKQPDVLRAAVIGQSPDGRLDPYTALNALKLVNESNRMMMAGQAQQPTSSPSLVAQNMAPQAGLGAMVPGAMGQAPQGMPPQAPAAPAPVMQAASGGLASMPTKDFGYAQGGIVAFKDEGLVSDEGMVANAVKDDPYSRQQNEDDELGYLTGNKPELDDDDDNDNDSTADQKTQAAKNVKQSRAELLGMKDEGLSQAEFNRIRQDSLDFAKRNAGPNIYEPANRRLREREEARGKNVSQGQGLALLAAAGAILEGNSLARGAAKAFPVFAQQMGEVQRADIAEQRSIESMQFSLADAQRKERMGDIRGAQAAAETARKEKNDANRFRLNKAQALARLDADVYKAVNRPNKSAGAQPSGFNVLFNAKQALSKDPKNPELQAAVKNAEQAVAATKTNFSTSEIGGVNAATRLVPTQARIDADVIEKLGDFKDNDRAYNKARRAKDTTETNRLLQAEETRLRAAYTTPAAGNAPAPKPSAAPTSTAPKPTTATKVVSMADVNATVASSGKTKQEVMDALKAKNYTVK